MENQQKTSKPLLDFLIIGAMKSATTSLYNSLASSSEVAMTHDKEPEYLLKKSPEILYKKAFNNLHNKKKGEASTAYSKAPDILKVPEIAKKTLGEELKIIYIIRSPLERSISHIKHDYRLGRINNEELSGKKIRDEYINYSRYIYQINYWKNQFSEENILILDFEDIVNECKCAQEKITEFLEIKNFSIRTQGFTNNSKEKHVSHWIIRDAIVKNRIYREKVRKLIPKTIINKIKQITSTRNNIENISISENYMNSLKRRLNECGAIDEYNALSLKSR